MKSEPVSSGRRMAVSVSLSQSLSCSNELLILCSSSSTDRDANLSLSKRRDLGWSLSWLKKRPLGVFPELTEGCFPSLSCLVLRFEMGHDFLWPKGHFCAWKSYQVHHLLQIIMHFILFIFSCNLSTTAWAGKGRLKAQFAFNSGQTVSWSGRALQGGSGSIRILEDAVLTCWSTLLCFSEARKYPVILQ